MFLTKCWEILCELSPWLLLGMLLSGLMHVLLPKGFVRRKLQGTLGVVKAVGLGVPLPLCSCGVVPAGIGLKNQGASSGAAVGFLISTPQTGIDSILVSASFFGWPFAIFKMATAAITGVVGGWLTDAAVGKDIVGDPSNKLHSHEVVVGGSFWEKVVAVWEHGIEIVRSIWVWLVIGILISAVIETVIPASWFETVGNWGLLAAMLLMLVVSLPLYVCATASVPIAAAIVNGGLPPAAALVFLMAGPATNITTIGAINSRFGWKTLTVYLGTIILGSMFFAWLFSWVLTASVSDAVGHNHHHQTWWSIASAIGLILMLCWFCFEQLQRKFRGESHSHSNCCDVESGESVAASLEVTVEGMTCGGCVSKLEKALRKNTGVRSATVQLEPGLAKVIGDINREEIYAIINKLGFRAVP